MSGARRRFRFIKEIAEGGFGKVYLAEQLSSDGFSRIVAVKLLHAKWSSHDEVVMRTRDEARLLGLIRHTHIVRVEDLTSIDGKCALIMEYLEGVDLKQMVAYLQERGLEFPRGALFEALIAVCGALDAAFNGLPLQGGEPLRVIHRDIKPSNIFVTVAGGVKVLDFGTARANFAEREAKTQALAFGSQGYMAPERMLGEEDTPAADVFSLGVTLYELLTLESFGRIPPRPNKFVAKVEERIKAVPLTGDPEWCDQVRETLRLMLAYEPRERPSAAQLVDIFEILAQNANDMAMRRFCRTLVAEAKAKQPAFETGDPLVSSVVDEDVSTAFGVGSGGVPQVAGGGDAGSDPFGAAPPPPKAGSLGAAPPPPGAFGGGAGPALALSSGEGSAQTPVRSAKVTPAPAPRRAEIEDEPEPKKKGGGMRIVLIVVVLLLVLGGGVILVGAVLAGVAVAVSTPTSVETPTPIDVPETPKKPEVALPAGGKVTEDDTRTDVGRSTNTTLSLGGAGGLVQITGPVGSPFKAEWDGKADFDLGALVAGKFRTNVTPKGGSKIRNKTFEVVAKKKCTFKFDVKKEAWEGECK